MVNFLCIYRIGYQIFHYFFQVSLFLCAGHFLLGSKMSEIDFSLSPTVADIVRILGVSSESAAIVKSDIRSFRDLSKFLSREENNHFGGFQI